MKSLFSGNNRDVVFPCKSIIKVSVKIYKYINLIKIVHTCTSYKNVAVYVASQFKKLYQNVKINSICANMLMYLQRLATLKKHRKLTLLILFLKEVLNF